MKILLTGATGFLGGALARHWIHSGHDLTVIVRSGSVQKLSGFDLKKLNVAAYASDEDVADAVNESTPDVIVHTACSYGRVGESLAQISDANLRFGLVLLQNLLKGGRKARFLNTGTVLDASTNAYALSKWQMTEWGKATVNNNPKHTQFVNVLLQHMYGPGDSPSKFTTHVLHSCRDNVPKLDLTAGQQMRDFIYIDDVVNAYDVLLNNLDNLDSFEHVEVGSGTAPSIRQFVETAHRLTCSETTLNFGAIPYRANEAMSCCADTTRMRTLGWIPAFDLESGLRRTLNLELNT